MSTRDTFKSGGEAGKKKLRLKLTFKEMSSLEFDEAQAESFRAFLTNTRLEVPGFGRIQPTEFSLEVESFDSRPAMPIISQTLAREAQPGQMLHNGHHSPINITFRCINPANPTQYEGTINGRAFYFRYIHGFWSLIIYQIQQGRPYYVEGLAGSRDDCRMEENEVLAILRGCAHDCLTGLPAQENREQANALNWIEMEQDSLIY
jgi:hypothetical protein